MKDKKFAYDVCNPQMMEYLLANRDLKIEIQGPVNSLAFEPQLPSNKSNSTCNGSSKSALFYPEYLCYKK